MKFSHILIDMDGVLADFVGGVLTLFGWPESHQAKYDAWPKGEYDLAKVLGVSNSELWRVVQIEGTSFWKNLKACPEAEQLMVEIYKSRIPFTVVTSPSRDPLCAAGKVYWLQNFFDKSFRSYFIGSQKWLLAKEGVLLIDDYDVNCEAFSMHGGKAFTWPRPWNKYHAADRWKTLEFVLENKTVQSTCCGEEIVA